MLSKELEFTLNLAFKEAREKQHEFMTVEHLLYALLGNPSAVEVLRACMLKGASLLDMWLPITVLAVFGVVILAAASLRFRRQLA